MGWPAPFAPLSILHERLLLRRYCPCRFRLKHYSILDSHRHSPARRAWADCTWRENLPLYIYIYIYIYICTMDSASVPFFLDSSKHISHVVNSFPQGPAFMNLQKPHSGLDSASCCGGLLLHVCKELSYVDKEQTIPDKTKGSLKTVNVADVGGKGLRLWHDAEYHDDDPLTVYITCCRACRTGKVSNQTEASLLPSWTHWCASCH